MTTLSCSSASLNAFGSIRFGSSNVLCSFIASAVKMRPETDENCPMPPRLHVICSD